MRSLLFFSLVSMLSGSVQASSIACYASQTTAKPQAVAPVIPLAPTDGQQIIVSDEAPAFTIEEIPMEKTFVQEAGGEIIQFTSPSMKDKNLIISASVNTSGTDVTMLLRDLTTNAASVFTGGLGKDASVVANLATSINGEQKLIHLTCHAAIAAGNLAPHSPQNF